MGGNLKYFEQLKKILFEPSAIAERRPPKVNLS
jgi:hypothetical protein